MSANVNSVSREIFAAIKYKAFDYVCETTTNLKVTMNWLALPMPYHTDNSDLYPHTGNLPEVTYRTPWIRGKVISTCKLFVGGSALDDLGGKEQQINSLESFDVTMSQVKGHSLEMIPSSNPSSEEDLDLDEAFSLLKESQINNPCQESFSKYKPDQMHQRNHNMDLLLPEEVIPVSDLPQFKRHLPTLKTKLSRLRTLPVDDPFLRSTEHSLSEDTILRHCASYEAPPDLYTSDIQTCSNIYEEFGKETLINEESLLLPVELDTVIFSRENCSIFPSIWDIMNISPELLEEQLPVLDVLHRAAFLAVDISQFDICKELTADCKMNEGLIDTQSAGRLVLPTEMEVDMILTQTPNSTLTQTCLSTSELQEEQLSPVCSRYLVSEGDQKEMELALWKAEKHPNFVLRFLLAEPQVAGPVVEPPPPSETLKLLKISEESFVMVDKVQSLMETGVPQMFVSSCCEFTERMSSEFPPVKEDKMEDFTKMSLHQTEFPVIEVRLKSILKNPLRPAPLYHQEKSGNTASLAEADESATPCKKASAGDPSQSILPPHNIAAQNEKGKTGASVFSAADIISDSEADSPGKMSSVCAAVSSTLKEAIVHTDRDEGESQPELSASVPVQSVPPRLSVRHNKRSFPAAKHLPKKDLDPLSTFMMLRSQLRDSAPVSSQNCPSSPDPKVMQQTSQPDLQPTPEEMQGLDRRPAYMSETVTGNATREQIPASQPVSHTVHEPTPQKGPGSNVVQVQVTETQWRAYCELLAFAQPCLHRAKEMGLVSPAWRDFSSLGPDQTHFLLKQQEMELSRTRGEELVREQELLFNQAALVHVLVTVKNLVLKCDLSTAVAYLAKAAEGCAGQRLQQLVKRLQILLYLGQKNQEPNVKLLELQDQLATCLHRRKQQNTTDKVLVIIAVDSDDVRSMLIEGLSQVAGTAVMAVCPEKPKAKLNGARMVNSMRDSVCVVVCGLHIGADFPWQCFSLVVEFDHSGLSPWAAVCRERSIDHLSFHTILPNAESDTASWCLEDSVPYVLIVTEGLLNCPLLLQTLETTFNITVLERSHSPSLQMIGGTDRYAVITVDESTAVIIQEQEELCRERACEGVAMRLSALSLQYSCCWLILHCPDSQGGFSSEAFSNLVLVYSSLVLFGMKSEDLDVKVLIVSDVLEIAKWISQICFHSLTSSDRDALSYLDRDWLSVMSSEEEERLLRFPCVNPLVSQLMLKRAPSLQWLLGASLSQLKELLPEVPHKVLKLFSDTTSLYKLTSVPCRTESEAEFTQKDHSPPNSPWTTSADLQSPQSNPQSEPFSAEYTTSFLSQAESPARSFCEPEPGIGSSADFQVDLGLSFGTSDSHFHQSWTKSDPWKKEDGEQEEMKVSSWSRIGRAVGKVVERGSDDWTQRAPADHDVYTEFLHATDDDDPFKMESAFSFSASLNQPAYAHDSQMFSYTSAYTDLQQPYSHDAAYGLRSPTGEVPWGGGHSGSPCSRRGMTRMCPSYGSRYWMGQERKRSGEVEGLIGAALTPLKKSKLSYERVPGRSDGQTRLRFF